MAEPVEPPDLIRPSQVADRAARSFARNLKSWIFDGAAASAASLTARLGAPSEAAAAAHRALVQSWVHEWQGSTLEVRWEERRWPSLGLQRLPASVTVDGAGAIAALAGRTTEWRRAADRRDRLFLLDSSPGWPAAVAEAFRYWNVMGDEDFTRLVQVSSWLAAHPRSGLLIRQLPIVGVDTKWLERHATVVRTLVGPLGVAPELGLRRRDRLRPIMLCDPQRRGAAPRILAASDAELAQLPLAPDRVLVVENLQTLEALPDLPDTVAVFGSGNDAVAVAALPWVRSARDVVYWGDLDTAGLGILARFRAALACRSILMDRSTLNRWHLLAVPGPAADPVDENLLTADEVAALQLLRRDALRLEQERIPIAAAIGALLSATGQAPEPQRSD